MDDDLVLVASGPKQCGPKLWREAEEKGERKHIHERTQPTQSSATAVCRELHGPRIDAAPPRLRATTDLHVFGMEVVCI